MKSLYIHIPFCNRICSYCDFAKVFYSKENIDKYLNCLEQEIISNYKKEKIETIYIGGGTPSCLSINELDKLFSIINKHIDLSNIKEYTIECNIESLTESKLKLFKENSVNRLSIGVQSFDKRVLKYLNRDDNVDIISVINLCKKYFDNINIDLLYGIPNMSLEQVKHDLDIFLSLDLPHISYYSLIIEPHTKLYIDNTKNIDEEEEYEMYTFIENTLEKNGYIHYETSNYCKPSFNSIHNLTYWNNEEYYGFGCGASGFIGNIRYSNTRSLTLYLKGNCNREIEEITKEIDMQNEMILGLRKLDGVNKNKFLIKYGINIYDSFDISDLTSEGKLIDDGENIKINKKYIYLSNEVLVRFID